MKDRCKHCAVPLNSAGEHVREVTDHLPTPRYSRSEQGTTVRLFEYDDDGKCKPTNR